MNVPDFPGVVRIEPSSSCNLACTHCPTGTIKIARQVMSEEVFQEVVNQISKELDSIRVCVLYHGGEPLLNKRFISMVKTLKEIGIPKIKTVSNGMLLTEKIALEIIESGIDEIEISLDGESIEENNEVRVRSDFNTVVKNVSFLLEAIQDKKTPKVSISTTQFFRDKNQALKGGEATAPTFIRDAFKNFPHLEYKPTWAMKWPHINIDKEIYEEFVVGKEDEVVNNYCDHVYNTITIRSNGEIVPCCYDLTSQLVAGNIMQSSLREIWKNSFYSNLRNSLEEGCPTGICAACNVVKAETYLIKKNKF